MGLRPISYKFGDMLNYDKELRLYAFGAEFDFEKDRLFELMKYFFAKNLNSKSFFFTCTLLYIYPLYSVCRKLFVNYWFYGFFILLCSFSFWTYGVNGIRNGIATSLFLYALTRSNFLIRLTLLIATIFIHKSLFIVVIIYLFASYFKNTKSYLILWFIAIPLSLVLGGFFENLFLGFGFGGDKLETYLVGVNQASEGIKLKVGFRWDFLLYSSTGVFASWYFIVKRKFEDEKYQLLSNIYILSNTFWILIIRASFSNRFAYLSWFLLGLIIIYPLLKSRFSHKQHQIIGVILITYFCFTYLLNVILAA